MTEVTHLWTRAPQVTAGDTFNQPPNLFMCEAGFNFFYGNNITSRQKTGLFLASQNDFCLVPLSVAFVSSSVKRT